MEQDASTEALHRIKRRLTPPQPVKTWKLVLLGLLLLAVGVSLGWLALTLNGYEKTAKGAQLAPADITKTLLVLVAPLVGVATLMLNIRKQSHVESEAAKRDVNEMRLMAAELLKSGENDIRLLGLQTLENIGQLYPHERQKIMDSWCEYLRKPYVHSVAGEHTTAERQEEAHRMRLEEMLASHLRSPDGPKWLSAHYGSARQRKRMYWDGMDINLDFAMLFGCVYDGCDFRQASFVGTQFMRPASFMGAQFRQAALFPNCRFTHGARFSNDGRQEAHFYGDVTFSKAVFGPSGPPNAVCFDNVSFDKNCVFYQTVFNMPASFRLARFGNLRSRGYDLLLKETSGNIDLTNAKVATTTAKIVLPKGWKAVPADKALGTFSIVGWAPILRASTKQEKSL